MCLLQSCLQVPLLLSETQEVELLSQLLLLENNYFNTNRITFKRQLTAQVCNISGNLILKRAKTNDYFPRRHINPVTVDGEDLERKMLVMKDLNVQYFPCKICGAKFPSYYFVHKHKKLWHAGQLEQEELKLEQNDGGPG